MIHLTLANYYRCFLWLVLFCAAVSVAAQVSPAVRSAQSQRTMEREDLYLRRNQENRERDLRRVGSQRPVVRYWRSSVSVAKKTKDVKKRLLINQEDLSANAAFLKSPDTGIFKLLPLVNCSVVSKPKEARRCGEENAGIRFFANSYSFNERQYTSPLDASFSLIENELSAVNSEIQNIIVNLGDVPLENLTLESEGVLFLKNLKPATKIAEVRKQFELISAGITDGKYKYSKSEPLKLNDTYVIRAIAYDGNKFLFSEAPSDVIVAMKLIRFETDGSVTFIWKQLKSESAPKLVYEEQTHSESN